MNLTFIGADHEVTGSCYLIEINDKKMLVDCGLNQGIDIYESIEIPVPISEIDYVLLTHAHIDHSGKFPLLYQHGFRGKIFATEGTADLCEIMLRDSAHIQMFEAEWKSRKSKRQGGKEVQPLYDMNDAEGTLRHFIGCEYGKKINIADGVIIRFSDAGHLLGSSSIEVWLKEDGISKKVVFSGDIGNTNQPLIRDPQYIKTADVVITESTYGTRSHGPRPDYVKELSHIIQSTFDRGGNVVIPSFAVGRTQELLYFIRQIKEQKLILGHDNFSVFVDSPLAVEATNIFNERGYDDFDEEAIELIKNGINPILFDGLITTTTTDESKNINFVQEPKVIISASGMCEAGRVKHHLKHNLWRAECTVLFVGYQALGTLGRSLVEGAKKVKLFGEEINVKAEIRVLAGASGHADVDGLLKWIKSFEPKPNQVFVCHGDDKTCEAYSERLKAELSLNSYAPFSGTVYNIAASEFVKIAEPIPVKKVERKKTPSTVYARLISAGERLKAVIAQNEGGANKDIAKFADQITALCDKWER